LAKAIIEEAKKMGVEISEPERFEYSVGKGVYGISEGKIVLLGNERFLVEKGIIVSENVKETVKKMEEEGKTVLYVSVDGVLAGILGVSDTIRDEVSNALNDLKKLGIKRFIMLTGDNERVAKSVAKKLGINEWKAHLLPEDKIEVVKKLQEEGYKVCMVGDGVNDAPALTQADVGIAMAVAGTDTAIESAHIALMSDDWSKIPQAIQIGRKTYKIIRQGISLGIIWDLVTMSLASVGILTPVMASALEELPTLVVALNASRLAVRSK
jgi:Cd2+/Zn2+-exporting ATPase/Cu+-exporting ATPase